MISYVNGTVQKITPTYAIIDVGGFGIKIYSTTTTLNSLKYGQKHLLETAFIVKEDSQTLYGFSNEKEREIFEILLTVSGIGPRIGLAILNTHSISTLESAVENNDDTIFSQVAGIGPKGAKKIVLELSGKIVSSATNTENNEESESTYPNLGWENTLIQALVGLGWQEKQAKIEINKLKKEDAELVATQDTSKILKKVLTNLGQKKSSQARSSKIEEGL